MQVSLPQWPNSVPVSKPKHVVVSEVVTRQAAPEIVTSMTPTPAISKEKFSMRLIQIILNCLILNYYFDVIYINNNGSTYSI